MSLFSTIRSPSDSSAALGCEQRCCGGITLAEEADAPLNVGMGVGGEAVELHCPATVTPEAPICERSQRYDTVELVSIT